MLENFEKAPNPIERKDILLRINQNKYKNNPDRQSRQAILYEILPFVSDLDFTTAVANGAVDEITLNLQVRFNYWINKFESKYNEITSFYNLLDGEKNERMFLINELIKDLVVDELPKKEDKPITQIQ